ncbi:MAG: hypothetical protein J2P17_11215 [Mycobacterium sp.]|nr:hypothetical protein [Mycobacterium sp.]
MQQVTTDRAIPTHGRRAVAALYLAASIPPGSWIGRIPDIKVALAANDARWGFANSLGTLGELIGYVAIALLIGRVSTRRIAILASIIVVLASPMLAFAPTLTALSASLFVWMVAGKALGTTMGALALVEQRHAGRVLMTRYDAVYSLGMLAGGGLAWACIRTAVPPGWQFAVTNLILLTGLLVAIRHLRDEEASPTADECSVRRLAHRLQPTLLLLAGISLLASLIDSALSQWGALFLTTISGGDASWGALVYPAMMCTKIIILIRMDRLINIIGWSRTLYLSTVLTSAAIITATITKSSTVALIGLALVGAGTAVLGPLVNTGAAEQPRLSAGEARTMLELGEIPAYLVMPAIIGLLSTQIGLGRAIQLATLTAILGCAAIGRITRVDDS